MTVKTLNEKNVTILGDKVKSYLDENGIDDVSKVIVQYSVIYTEYNFSREYSCIIIH